ncbi:transmembrane protein 187 [Microcaecilia unicolor]|uniref:Transmembrane protein 187 n=1 Tax=Microcaecilia unicolor TaxID=1415580 RepID=A0A6P7WYG6_9AMPH|nr:transmembrane protein 187 [Microcaecilia unicolor]
MKLLWVDEQALLHVAASCCLCFLVVSTGLFDGVATEVGYGNYAEEVVTWLPAFVAMPFNCSINIGYMLLGIFWLHRWRKTQRQKDFRRMYMKDIFALMAIIYGPVQWARLWTQSHRTAVLDQWFTLPIFAWVLVWCKSILDGWKPLIILLIEGLSLASYSLCLLHSCGFEVALGCHVLGALLSALQVQRRYGDSTSWMYFWLTLMYCFGFITLKLLDHSLTQWLLFRRLTGHFWSKVCDIMQFHCAFRFLERVEQCSVLKVQM